MVIDSKELTKRVEHAYNSLTDIPKHNPAQIAMAKKAIELYITSFQLVDREHVRDFVVGDRYIQHSPLVADGIDSIFEFGETRSAMAAAAWGRPDERPKPEFRYKRIFVDGDFVICHMHAVQYPGDAGLNCMDVFRFNRAHDRIVEHWESISEVVPAGVLKHGNSQF